ncbi:hypothetical protein BH11ARM1_BH11ARM1_02960 [soil metagenome]
MVALILAVTQALPVTQTFKVDGVERKALVYYGSGAAPAAGRSLVFGFHGHGGNMMNSARSWRVQELWPEATVIYPQGLPTKGMTDPDGKKNGWQQKVGDSDDRDLKFVDAILAWAPKIDKKRVFTMGHSNGARFSYVLWKARGDKFAGYGVSGSPSVLPIRDLKAAPFFATAGLSDPIIPYRGQQMSIDFISKQEGAKLESNPDHVVWATGNNGIKVGTYIFNGGHEFPKEPSRQL